MRLNFSNFLRDEEGATAIEYGLIAALIAVVAMVAMGNVGTSLEKIFSSIATKLGFTAPSGGGGTGGS
ncbi:Flp family type IVb pilin [Comamonas avium]|uniref:Flp family type IVb pilin n=1 Tax=Comamonas avium TaxID=2762231 RepID=A0ABR8S8X5_9BURK|nr:Flp family type IVb pilin [Comamonas avium]MBD7959932.1 Flp family type IVb pilin [Comamonas avium]